MSGRALTDGFVSATSSIAKISKVFFVKPGHSKYLKNEEITVCCGFYNPRNQKNRDIMQGKPC